MFDEFLFLGGAVLFFLAVIVFWAGWAAKEKATKQQDVLNRWEADLTEWATAQHENIAAMQQQAALLQQELETTQQEAESHALAMRANDEEIARMVTELKRVTAERDKVRADFEKFVDFLVDAGVIQKSDDALPTYSEKLEEFYLEATTGSLLPPNVHFPKVYGFTKKQLHAALLHAAERAFSSHAYASRPFTKSYMVAEGPLSREQFDRLHEALVDQGYLEAASERSSVFKLTEAGWNLLQAIKEGRLVG
ncbi:MAG: hypothetical protein JXA33_21670 [Anaerolineae bacterium]|nr:hypothetical protein [Anaerolineae bacterium]